MTREYGLVRALKSRISVTEAAGLANAVAGIAFSFDRGLLPRTTPQQAVLTGLWGATTYGITATIQSFVAAGVERAGGGRLPTPAKRRAALMAGDAAALALGVAMQKALPRTPEEPLARAGVRTVGWRLSLAGTAGLLALTLDAAPTVLRHPPHEGSVNSVAAIAAGAGVATAMYAYQARRLRASGAATDQYGDPVSDRRYRPGRAAAVGTLLSGGLFVTSRGERFLAHRVADAVTAIAPSAQPYARALGHAATFTAGTFAAMQGISVLYRNAERAGDAVEAAYAARPDSPYVSGGSRTAEDWSTFGREGRRYVNTALTAAEITAVTGREAINPIRAYVGLGTDISPNRRAARALRELELLGGFVRKHIAVFFPTGTGYVNYVALEALEYFTDGDVASVAIQYSLRPSPMSLGNVGTARESNLLLLNRLAERLGSIPAERRPKVLLFGESLGSLGGQDVLEPEGTDDLDLLRVEQAVFVGTPYASKWRQRWLLHPEVVDPEGIVAEVQNIEEWRALPPEVRQRNRVLLLTHNNDPIPKFGAPLIIQEPTWLGPPAARPRGVPLEMDFMPGLTFLMVAVDLFNANGVVPGPFQSWAHDYRADLAEIISAAYRLPVEPHVMESVERALRQREMLWAERRAAGEKLEHAERQVRDKMTELGLDAGSIPNFVRANRPAAADPYAVTE